MSNEKETKVSALDAKAKALANEEDEDTKIAKLLKNMPKWRFYSLAVLTVIWTVFQLYIKLVKPLDPWFQLPLHMCLALVVVWLYNPMVEKSKSHNKLWWIYDIFLIASSCFICWFFLSHAEQLNYRIFNVDVMTTTEVIVAVLLVINVMEAVRRVVSMSLFWVICFFLAYAWFGQYIPGLFRFSGISFPKLMEVLMYGENGIFGSPLVTSLGTLFYFLVFGTFFSNCGGGGVLIDGGMKLSDKTVGGPAKAAVISSGLMGMISGSAVANVATTGVMTIPMMKKTGYPPEFAGAVEAASSTGGQIMPPIMGAAAFLMAEMVGVPYAKIIVRAILPAFLYFLGIFLGVHFKAKKLGLKGLPREELPKWKLLLPQIYLILPLVVLVYMIMIGFTMATAAVYATLYCVVVAMISREEGKKKLIMAVPLIPLLFMTLMSRSFEPGTFMGEKGSTLCLAIAFVLLVINYAISKPNVKSLPTIIDAFENGGKNCLSVGIACGMAGIIAGVVTMTGLGQVLIGAIVGLSNGHLIIALVLTMLCCIVLGMGVPTTANYCIMASTCAPILITLGIPKVAAHFFVFYFGIVADITPPVALAAYAGSAIAKSDPMKTGVNATKLAIAAFIVPYIFAMNPSMLLMDQGVLAAIQVIITSCLGIFAIAAALEGYIVTRTPWWQRILLAAGGLCLIDPDLMTDVVGIAVIAVVIVLQIVMRKRSTPAAA